MIDGETGERTIHTLVKSQDEVGAAVFPETLATTQQRKAAKILMHPTTLKATTWIVEKVF